MIEKRTTNLEGCFEFFPVIRKDNRGSFVKTFHEEDFQIMNFPLKYKEEYSRDNDLKTEKRSGRNSRSGMASTVYEICFVHETSNPSERLIDCIT